MQNSLNEFSIEIGGKTIRLQVGLAAKQANGSVFVTLGETVVLSAVCAASKPKEDAQFMPLTVDYRERTYCKGAIPGGFFKREGRPKESEILSSRLTDRSLRPLFPERFYHEMTVSNVVLSSDGENDADVLTLLGASCALAVSDIPFNGPVAALRVGRIGRQFVLNPTFTELAQSDLDLVISATKNGIVMVEGGAKLVSEEELLEAMRYAWPSLKLLCEFQEEIAAKAGKPKFAYTPFAWNEDLKRALEGDYGVKINELAHRHPEKKQMTQEMDVMAAQARQRYGEKYPQYLTQIEGILDEMLAYEGRKMLLEEGTRLDGRKPDEIRPISIQLGLLPRAHGSAMFRRGQTQTLATTTLGTPKDTQKLEELEGDYFERFLFHYNFPGFSVGECRPDRGPGRREIGHGFLARRALLAVLPKEEDFPYTIRLVSDILESNGSTSMASVCGGSLALFDAAVPIADHVGGIAMGLVMEGGRHVVLTDIMGTEDHIGDMDFKVAGTKDGITAFQMDVKVPAVGFDILAEALEKARLARLTILDKMVQAIGHPRTSLSIHAPKMVVVSIPVDKIGVIIGPGGKNIRRMSEEYQVEIEVQDDGRVFIHAKNWDNVERTKAMVEAMTKDPEVGEIYKGHVVSITDFGAFVEILPGREGLLHVSQIENRPLRHTRDVLTEGDEVEVKVIDIDDQGKVRLSRRAVLYPESEGAGPGQAPASGAHGTPVRGGPRAPGAHPQGSDAQGTGLPRPRGFGLRPRGRKDHRMGRHPRGGGHREHTSRNF